MHELTKASNIKKLPKGKHSVKGVGMTHPDPSVTKELHGAEVPLGKPVPSAIKSSLLYNEYIIYDIAQVQMKYLLQLDFKYKY